VCRDRGRLRSAVRGRRVPRRWPVHPPGRRGASGHWRPRFRRRFTLVRIAAHSHPLPGDGERFAQRVVIRSGPPYHLRPSVTSCPSPLLVPAQPAYPARGAYSPRSRSATATYIGPGRVPERFVSCLKPSRSHQQHGRPGAGTAPFASAVQGPVDGGRGWAAGQRVVVLHVEELVGERGAVQPQRHLAAPWSPARRVLAPDGPVAGYREDAVELVPYCQRQQQHGPVLSRALSRLRSARPARAAYTVSSRWLTAQHRRMCPAAAACPTSPPPASPWPATISTSPGGRGTA